MSLLHVLLFVLQARFNNNNNNNNCVRVCFSMCNNYKSFLFGLLQFESLLVIVFVLSGFVPACVCAMHVV